MAIFLTIVLTIVIALVIVRTCHYYRILIMLFGG